MIGGVAVTSFERMEPWDRSPLPILAAWFEDEEASRERMDGIFRLEMVW
ncbi:hypothetical protein ABEX25_03230 [Paenibacillus thiaminolyticus]